MPWDNSPEKRERDKRVYGDPQYKANRKLALKRADGRCEEITGGRPCGSRDRVQVDHVIPVSQGGTHHLDNLRALCKPCHDRKTAQEGKGYRRGGRKRREADPVLTPRTKW